VGRLLLCRGQRQEDSLQRDTETSPAVQVNPDAELAAHAQFRAQLYSYDVVPYGKAATLRVTKA
jgi:hypothetical protein